MPLDPTLHFQVASNNGNGLRWFQLYVYKDRDVVTSLVRRAEAAGYTAIALTVDAPILGRRCGLSVANAYCYSVNDDVELISYS